MIQCVTSLLTLSWKFLLSDQQAV